jgi:serine/threonine-protein kinase
MEARDARDRDAPAADEAGTAPAQAPTLQSEKDAERAVTGPRVLERTDERVETPAEPEPVRTLASGEAATPPPAPASAVERIEAPVGVAPEDRYERLEVLGAGGMGEVVLCKDRWIGREVAMKTMRPSSLPSMEARERFTREMRVQGQLEHPSIVPAYDAGVTADGELYFTMRRLKGRTLEQILGDLARGDAEVTARMSRRKLLTAFVSVCLAVHYAHTRGVLHRDLKPSNLMLGELGEVYVLDWGIAKIVDAGALLGTATQTGSLMGTPAYMAPEQLLGKTSLDARTDVYSLGLILFELLALRPLHRGKATPEIIESTVIGLDPRPSLHLPDVGPDLDAICARAVTRDPDRRFASARELADAVERYLDGVRDVERQRALADEHAERAARAAARAARETVQSEAEQSRAEATREVVRALALAPAHAGATRTLVELLVTEPASMPAEVEAEVQNATMRHRLVSMRASLRTFVIWLAFLPAALLAGVRSFPFYGLSVGLVVACIAYTIWALRRRAVATWNNYVLASISAAAVATVGAWLGPFVVVPMAASVMVLLFSTLSMPRERPVLLGIWSLAVVVPCALELAGVVPPSYRFEGGALVLLPRAYGLPAWPTMGGLLYVSLAWVLIPPFLLARVHDALRRAERQLLLHAWQFRRLLPGDAAGSTPA